MTTPFPKPLAHRYSLPCTSLFPAICRRFASPPWALLFLLGVLPGVSQPVSQAPPPADTARLTGRVFRLGEVQVIGQRPGDSASTAGFRQFEAFNRLDAARALSLLPGVTLGSVGARNESVVFVRGFDLRQVPVFIDGIPVYVPYDGYVDLGRFTTFDLAEVNVAKGFSSVAYGPNTLGGAINLVSRRPKERFEFDARAGLMSGNGYRLNLNAGSNLGKFYVQGGLSQLERDTYPLADDFERSRPEEGENRDNAYRRDRKYSVKVGFTPRAGDEYALSYVNQRGRKGNPAYVGGDPLQRPRFWQWPYWNKESVYFISRTSVGAGGYLKTRLYSDWFANALHAFDDRTYTTQDRPSSFQSFYKDDTYGAILEYGHAFGTTHALKATAQYKHDRHRENNLGEPRRTTRDQTLSVGVEDVYRLGAKLSVLPGVSFNHRRTLRADHYNAPTGEITGFPAGGNGALNAQVAVHYALTEWQQLQASVARKSRFPTIKDRYSYRLGMALPNPGLKAEWATHYEASYRGATAGGITFQTSLFLSRLTDVIQQVNEVQPNLFQLQNAGQAVFYGGEFSATYPVLPALQTGVQYSFVQRENRTRPELKFTDVPPHKVLWHAQYDYRQRASLWASFEYNAPRYSTSYGTKASDYGLVNLKASAKVYRFISLEGGINNALDKSYALVEGFPEEGRNYFLNLVISNL